MVVKVFLAVITEPGHQSEISATLKTFEEVVLACPVKSGPFDVVAMVEVESLDGYRLLIEKVAAITHTTDFSSFITTDS